MINVGLIGYGLSGSVFHAPFIDRVEGLNLKAVVSSNADKVQQDYPGVEVVPDIDHLLKDHQVDVVVISSPNMTHYEFAKKSIEAGKHVVVEKPFTVSSAEADALIALAEKKQVLLTVYQNRRWDNDFLTVKSLLDTQMLGNLSTYEAHFDRYRPKVQQRWREKNLPGSGMLYDLGSHLIDQALHLFGTPATVWADLRAERDGAEAIDYFHIILGYPKLRAILHSSSLVSKAGPRFVLHGDRGSFVKYGLDPQEEQLKQGIRPGDAGWGQDRPQDHGELSVKLGELALQGKIETLTGRYESYYEGLVQAIRFGTPVPVPAQDARDTIRMIEYAMQSHQEQRTVTVISKNNEV